MTELQKKLQVCESNLVRVTRADRRIIVELKEETGVQMSMTETGEE